MKIKTIILILILIVLLINTVLLAYEVVGRPCLIRSRRKVNPFPEREVPEAEERTPAIPVPKSPESWWEIDPEWWGVWA